MARLHALLFFLLPPLLHGQAVPPAAHSELVLALQAIGTAANDAGRDSASQRVKQLLGDVLRSDSAMQARFAGVPITRVDAPDGAFRLFTWNVEQADGTFRYEGALLVAHNNGTELYELQDKTGQIARPESAQLNPGNWYGALYYEVVPVKDGRKTYYTLLGWKGHSQVETRKVIDVLYLSGPTPRFGAPLFTTDNKRQSRKVYAYTAAGKMLLRWEPAYKSIVLDHLSPTVAELAGQPAFMAPDLSFDSFTWEKDRWQFHRDVDLRGPERGKPYHAPPKEQR
ncbi:MAG: hypothetical protein KBH07_05945 [Flavobacteriales bacterium]|nr:hypothetical protein [Flavobacteriales bacterium]MBP9079896.1 hypothetical protein [Flavobacteriales bacterium]